MPKRRSGERGGGVRTAQRRWQHLYLVLDDWMWGYSIRKVNLSSSGSDSDDSAEPPEALPVEQRMPQAVFRVEAQRGFPQHFTAAFGSKIIAVLSMRNGFKYRPSAPSTSVPVFDLRRRGFMFGPRPEVDLIQPIYIPAGGRIFALSMDSFQVLYPPSKEPGSGECWEGLWRKLPMHPFKRESVVTSYALHPDGRTIFVSDEKGGTFTFDTAEEHFSWTEHGQWALPFAGRAHFDPSLGAWVGLSRGKGTKGHLACDAAQPDGGDDGRRPAWKVGKETLFSENPAEKHVGAMLVYMGGRSEFCLVQCVSREDGCPVGDVFVLDVYQPCRYVCRVTTFSLKLGGDGFPTIGDSRRVRCYKVPEGINGFTLREPVAFWM